MKLKLCFMGFLLAFSSLSFAQGGGLGPCPPGMHSSGAACDFDNAMIDSNNNPPSFQPQQKQEKWADTWGAIAIGNENDGTGAGVMGAATNMNNERQASKAALDECKAKGGGKSCKLRIAYYNQCAVVTWGDTGNNVTSAATVDIATEMSMANCSAKHANCSVYYWGCSPAKRIF
jgi:hypothetical protein